MKKITIKCSNEKMEKVKIGGDKEITPEQAILATIVSAVNNNPYTLEDSRKWAKIGDKLDSSTKETGGCVELEDDEFEFLQKMIKSGVEGKGQRQGIFKMNDRFWPDEVFRILDQAEKV